MKSIKFAILVALFPVASFAGQHCTTQDGATKIDLLVNRAGVGLILQGIPDVRAFYKSKGMDIESLVTVKDPETKKYTFEIIKGGYRFMIYSPDLGNFVWGADFTFDTGSLDQPTAQAQVLLTDKGGKSFAYNVSCTHTPDLE